MARATSTTFSDSSQPGLFDSPAIRRRKPPFTAEQCRQIAEAYASGKVIPELMVERECSQNKIERAIRLGGGRIRSNAEAGRMPGTREKRSKALRSFSDDEEKQIVADYIAEMPRRGLEAKWGCTLTAVYNALRRAGLKPRPRSHVTAHKRHVMRTIHRLLTDEQEQELADAYANNPTMSAAMLAEQYGVCEATALNVLKRRGVVRRDWTPKMLIPETYFDDADKDPVKAYLVGLYMADGCISRLRDGTGRVKRAASVTLNLCNGDLEHLETVRRFLGIEHKISTVPNKTGFGKGKTIAHRLGVVSERLALGLERWGLKERKSWGCRFIDLQHSRDAWRGVVDGDGWIIYSPWAGMMRPQIGVCGAPGVVMQFMDFCRTVVEAKVSPTKVRDTHWRINYVGWSAVQVIRALYANNPIALPRKDAKATQIMSAFSSIPSDRRPRLPPGVLRKITDMPAAAGRDENTITPGRSEADRYETVPK